MFESKLNIYYTQKSVERKVYWLCTEKVWKIGKINGLKYQLQALLWICQILDTKCYTSVACASSFLLISNILI